MMTDYYRICRTCQTPNLANASFCSHCGSLLPERVEIFLSYAHEDEKLLNELIKHLAILRRVGLAILWYDQDVSMGSEWGSTIDTHLNTAEIILLLISSDFIASEFCYSREMARAIERHRRNEACVIPIILRPTSWYETPFAKLQAIPTGAKAITTFGNKDEAFLEVAKGIQDVINKRFELTSKKLS